MQRSGLTGLSFLKNASSQQLRNQFLLPKGLTQTRSWNAPKEQRVKNFLDWKLVMKRTNVKLEPNWGLFEVDDHATKPEIKQYLEKGKFFLTQYGFRGFKNQ